MTCSLAGRRWHLVMLPQRRRFAECDHSVAGRRYVVIEPGRRGAPRPEWLAGLPGVMVRGRGSAWSALRCAMPDPLPVTKEEWLAAFRTEGERLRDLYNSKLVAAVALQEWVKHRDEDPVKVAQAWAARQGPTSAKR